MRSFPLLLCLILGVTAQTAEANSVDVPPDIAFSSCVLKKQDESTHLGLSGDELYYLSLLMCKQEEKNYTTFLSKSSRDLADHDRQLSSLKASLMESAQLKTIIYKLNQQPAQ
ncbi:MULTISPECIES: hypothetical protein [unclassified Vibrio]|uniref:hypothetical protein n=1 Tax=unclassified Vibrio TaxID=2614977 RepID=UPI001361877B|nr:MULTISPECIES: hypothetical protein [unclassified Vibrio]NAW59998.1 hypothetical protein [Vibrio sp. V36_P2S2PM302]NAX25532.1 hypothetical protein [Vibrio sp. V38_P2S17PM301]NAX32332.1 hypothetical protein [Vibrio sp. V37_P2S8PM304]